MLRDRPVSPRNALRRLHFKSIKKDSMEQIRLDRTNAERSRRARERQRAGHISLIIEADEVALVVMLIEQNLPPENLQDDKCAIAMKKKIFSNRRGGVK